MSKYICFLTLARLLIGGGLGLYGAAIVTSDPKWAMLIIVGSGIGFDQIIRQRQRPVK